MKSKWTVYALTGLCLIVTQTAFSAERVDFWVEELQMFGSAPRDRMITASLGGNVLDKKANKAITLDPVDKRNGDFSVCFTAGRAAHHIQAGFYCGKYQDNWPINSKWSLHLYLKAATKKSQSSWPVVLIDSAGKKARLKLDDFRPDGKWYEFALPLKDFAGEKGFDFSAIQMVVLD